ncbi:hypothetical protein [Streptomyces phytohabitans]|uniref:hypothetical protein n=1 Tax=Streptomyces phytohabitans TaxID=1150371 RepID=UPI00345BBCE6
MAFAKAVRGFASGATGSAFARRLRRAARPPGDHPDRGTGPGPSLGIDATTFAPLALAGNASTGGCGRAGGTGERACADRGFGEPGGARDRTPYAAGRRAA